MEKEPLPTPTIRETTFDDIPALRIMHAASWLATYPNEEAGVPEEWIYEKVSKWTTEEGLKKSREHFKGILGNPEHLHQVAVVEDRVVGLLHIFKKEHMYHLAALYIDKAYYGTGLAQRFMESAMQWAAPTTPIDLEVATYNDRAIRFYEKYGFKKVENSTHLFDEKVPILDMQRGDK